MSGERAHARARGRGPARGYRAPCGCTPAPTGAGSTRRRASRHARWRRWSSCSPSETGNHLEDGSVATRRVSREVPRGRPAQEDCSSECIRRGAPIAQGMVEELDDMTGRPTYDAVVVGAGPNGLAAAVELARNGCSVAVVEAQSTIGGGARSAELTLPGYVHDLGSAIHPFGYASPFFRSLPLEDHGLEWIHPPAPLAHPFDDGTAAMLERSTQDTGATLGLDAEAYRNIMDPLVEDARRIEATLTGSPQAPRHPLALAAAGLRSLCSARGVAGDMFEGAKAKGLFAGNAAHSFLPMEKRPSALFGLLLGTLGHAFGWPFPRGGSQKIADALVSYLLSLGGEVYTGVRISSVEEVPRTRMVLFDVTPRQLLDIAGQHFTEGYRNGLKQYRYGPGVFKVDFALDGPVPGRPKSAGAQAPSTSAARSTKSRRGRAL